MQIIHSALLLIPSRTPARSYVDRLFHVLEQHLGDSVSYSLPQDTESSQPSHFCSFYFYSYLFFLHYFAKIFDQFYYRCSSAQNTQRLTFFLVIFCWKRETKQVFCSFDSIISSTEVALFFSINWMDITFLSVLNVQNKEDTLQKINSLRE